MRPSLPPVPHPRTGTDACDGCGSCIDRRRFLATGVGSAALVALASLLPAPLRGAPVREVAARRRGAELRYPLPPADDVQVDRDNEVILVRHAGVVAAFALSCPHQRSMLRWREGDAIFQCTKHHSEYSPVGVYQKGRATRNMDRLALRLEADEVIVDPDTRFESDQDPAGWEAAHLEVA